MNDTGGAPLFVTVREAVRVTGLSERYLRDGLRADKIPHIKTGTKYLINLPLFLAELDNMSKRGAGE